MRYVPQSQTPAAKALTDALANHEHQAEQLRHAVRQFSQQLRERGFGLEDVLTELRVVFGRNVHLESARAGQNQKYEAKLENLMRLATDGFRAEALE